MYKIKLGFHICIISLPVFLFSAQVIKAQDSALNKYGLFVIENTEQFGKTLINNAQKHMVDLKTAIPNIIFDLRYATTDNFMHQQLYPSIHTTYLRKAAADSLKLVQKELNKSGLGLKIFDGYRPYSVTEKIWEPVKDDRYAADPRTGSGHNRGTSVDLTIVNLKNKQELDMGTGFDNFSDTAHHDFTNLPEEVLQNRLLLKNTMEKYGFKALDTEWWHYSLPNPKRFELMDLQFEQLGDLCRKDIKKSKGKNKIKNKMKNKVKV
jgi:zinc D-Ala-D-Ala dipeptidase